MRGKTGERVHRRLQSCRNAKDGDVRFYRARHPSGMRYGPERCTPPPPEHGRYARRRNASSLCSYQMTDPQKKLRKWHPGGMHRPVEKTPAPSGCIPAECIPSMVSGCAAKRASKFTEGCNPAGVQRKVMGGSFYVSFCRNFIPSRRKCPEKREICLCK
jgi:hypothetical protein